VPALSPKVSSAALKQAYPTLRQGSARITTRDLSFTRPSSVYNGNEEDIRFV